MVPTRPSRPATLPGWLGRAQTREDWPVSDIADRYRLVADRMTQIVDGVADGAWENPSPCAGWVARDLIRHMVDWMPGLLNSGAQVALTIEPSVDTHPADAWRALDAGIRRLLDDPQIAASEFVHERAGRHSLESAVGMFITGDVFIHTWDLARATAQDETLDADEVHRMLVGIEPMDEALRQSGHFGPRVEVAEDASEQDRLLAFVGRRP